MKGYFYIGQPIPNHAINRIKVGFTKRTVVDRIKDHKCVCPEFVLVKAYPCRKEWEYSLINLLKLHPKITFLSNEVLECENLDEVLNFCDSFFSRSPLIT